MVQLSLGNCFFLSDRLTVSREGREEPVLKMGVSNTSFIGSFFSSTRAQNEKTMQIFIGFMDRFVGVSRFERAQASMDVNFSEKLLSKSPLCSRDVAKVVTALKNVTCQDFDDLIQGVKKKEQWTRFIPRRLREELLKVQNFRDLEADIFHEVYQRLKNPIKNLDVPSIQGRVTGVPTERLARSFHDQFLSKREDAALYEINPSYNQSEFEEVVVKRLISREKEVGDLIPAYRDSEGRQIYYRVAARIVTPQGFVSYDLIPAVKSMHVETMRVYRGSKFRAEGLTALSTLYTDLEPKIGKSAFESGEPYLRILPDCDKEMGHSLGGVMVQYAAAKKPVRKFIIHNSPGVPKEIFDQFMERVGETTKVDIEVHHSKGDVVNTVGEYTLGYQQTPNPNLSVQFRRHYVRHPIGKRHTLHSTEGVQGFQGGFSNGTGGINKYLDHTVSGKEAIRKKIGKILCPIIAMILWIWRSIFGSRTEQMEGLTVECFNLDGKLFVKHIGKDQIPR